MDNELQSIEQAAQYRPGVASRIANLLTGGIYGEISGSAEKKRESDEARRFLLQSKMQEIQNQRMIERLKQGREESAQNELSRLKEQQAAYDASAIAREQRAREAKRAEMLGYLRGQPGYGSVYQDPGNLGIDILESMYSQAQTEEKQREEAQKRKSGYIQLNVPGLGTIQGTPEQIDAMKERYPELAKSISGQGVQKKAKNDVSVSFNPITNEWNPSFKFDADATPEEIQNTILKFGNILNKAAPAPAAAPAPPAAAPAQGKKPFKKIEGYDVRLVEKQN